MLTLDGAATRPARDASRPSAIGDIDASTPVVVLGAQAHGPLGIFRSLGRLGIAVHAVDAPPKAPPASSRYLRSRTVADLSNADALVEALVRLGDRLGRPAVLIPPSDHTTLVVDANRAALEGRYLLPHQPPGLAAALADKRTMATVAIEHGVPTPNVVVPASVKDVHAYAETATFPLMLKGIDGVRLRDRTGKKMVIVKDPAELLRRYEQMEDPSDPNLMLQEYIPGGDDSVWMFNGYFDRDSECLIGATGQKLRQTPIHTGATSLGIVRPNREVEETTTRWMKALGYRGILDIGYRFDARDGQYKVLDVNPRIGATFRLFVARNEMDVARALYLELTAQPVPTAHPWVGRRWINEGADVMSSMRYRREGALDLGEWLRSLRGIREGAYFAKDDLRPFVQMMGSLIRR